MAEFKDRKMLRKILLEELHCEGTEFKKIRGDFKSTIEFLIEDYIYNNLHKTSCPLKKFLALVEKKAIESALIKTSGNQEAACEILNVKQSALCEKIKRLKISKTKAKDMKNLKELSAK